LLTLSLRVSHGSVGHDCVRADDSCVGRARVLGEAAATTLVKYVAVTTSDIYHRREIIIHGGTIRAELGLNHRREQRCPVAVRHIRLVRYVFDTLLVRTGHYLGISRDDDPLFSTL
jgi:hypothetical protein